MQDILSISKNWRDPGISLSRTVTLILAVVALESAVLLVRDLIPLLSPVLLLGLARSAEALILLSFGPFSLKDRALSDVLMESLIITFLCIILGIMILFFWKNWIGASLLKVDIKLLARGKAHLIIFYGTSCLLSPVAEELFFRGLLYRKMREKWNAWACIASVSLLFALIHLYFSAQATVPFLGSLIFCLGYEKTKSILTPICLHTCGNLVIYFSPMIPFI